MSDDFLAPPAFKPEEALLLLKRGLRELRGLAERGRAFEWKGQPVIALAVEGAAITSRLAKRPAASPEWESRALKSAADVRKFGDEVKQRVARWRDADE